MLRGCIFVTAHPKLCQEDTKSDLGSRVALRPEPRCIDTTPLKKKPTTQLIPRDDGINAGVVQRDAKCIPRVIGQASLSSLSIAHTDITRIPSYSPSWKLLIQACQELPSDLRKVPDQAIVSKEEASASRPHRPNYALRAHK